VYLFVVLSYSDYSTLHLCKASILPCLAQRSFYSTAFKYGSVELSDRAAISDGRHRPTERPQQSCRPCEMYHFRYQAQWVGSDMAHWASLAFRLSVGFYNFGPNFTGHVRDRC
jgi:hypothetical protein